jgi:hypothetical protein
MKINAIICTRDRNNITKTTDKLLKFYVNCGINIYLMSGAKSLFSAYEAAFQKINPADEDIIIFCHDDIEIRDSAENFINKLKEALSLPETGFVGPAGTTFLGQNAVWWDADVWAAGKHRGKVSHINKNGAEYVTYYGNPGDVVVLDGLFLAAKAKTIREVGLEKPQDFEGEWDFYDIHYTSTAFFKGFTNKAISLDILHNSRGELVGRDSWHKNREAFIKKNQFPIKLED